MELKQRWKARDSFFNTIDLGIGLACGALFLGNVGSARRLDYTVLGTEVNIAQRLAAESTDCKVYITRDVYNDLDSEAGKWNNMGAMRLRGVNKPVQVYSSPGISRI